MKTLIKIGLWCILLHILPLVTVVIWMLGGYSFTDGYIVGMFFNALLFATYWIMVFVMYLLIQLGKI